MISNCKSCHMDCAWYSIMRVHWSCKKPWIETIQNRTQLFFLGFPDVITVIVPLHNQVSPSSSSNCWLQDTPRDTSKMLSVSAVPRLWQHLCSFTVKISQFSQEKPLQFSVIVGHGGACWERNQISFCFDDCYCKNQVPLSPFRAPESNWDIWTLMLTIA